MWELPPEGPEYAEYQPIDYRFEAVKPFDRYDWYKSAMIGVSAGFSGGILTYSKIIDKAAVDHDDDVSRLEEKIYGNANAAPDPTQVNKLDTLSVQSVPHASPYVGYAVGAAEAGIGTFAAAGLLMACRIAAFKVRRRRHQRIVEEASRVLEMDQSLRETPSSE